MSEMSEKEAKKIVLHYAKTDEPLFGDFYGLDFARGYIRRIEQEKRIFGPIIKALRDITSIADSYGPDNPMPQSTYFCAVEAKEALETFYKECPEWKK